MEIISRKLVYGGSKTNKPDKIVVHSMGENIKNNDITYNAFEWLKFLKLSAHALVTPNGDIIRCRDDEQRAWHAKGNNTNSLGVEFLVPGIHDYGTFLEMIKTDWVSKEQYQAGVELLKQWIEKYDIENVFRHRDLSPGRKVDPGDGFKWDWFMDQINTSSNPV
ncbi:MAG: N-acetylmuramoyl-L-alanine amidase [Gammaproteobacteria bacterium]|nr:N-acetylmuramoyl-L-alanine amidase [Gammaproteobacteria bacterium]MCP4978125.1 N-acetylmuramoyl-L-alanine amidase [Maribacter sp.]